MTPRPDGPDDKTTSMASIDQKKSATEKALDEKWAEIEKSETIVIKFTEMRGGNYFCMDISWNHPESARPDRRVQTGFKPDGYDDTSGQLLPDLTEAASRAANMRMLRVVYSDTEWVTMHPKLDRIIPLFTSVNGLRGTVRLDEENPIGFIVTFGDAIRFIFTFEDAIDDTAAAAADRLGKMKVEDNQAKRSSQEPPPRPSYPGSRQPVAWACEYCDHSRFKTYEEACAHKSMCQHNPDRAGSGRDATTTNRRTLPTNNSGFGSFGAGTPLSLPSPNVTRCRDFDVIADFANMPMVQRMKIRTCIWSRSCGELISPTLQLRQWCNA